MQRYTFKLFAQTATEQRLRLLDQNGKLVAERSLPLADIQRFIAEVEADYRSSKLDLSGLGRRLYAWLDGPTERWLATLRRPDPNLALHIDVEQQLRHLPWELLYDGQFLCGHLHNRFTPVRHVTDAVFPHSMGRANRPLRVLFMATSPEDVTPRLDYETEERLILEATARQPLELVVEESGSLDGLEEQVTVEDPGYFDVFHLTGHADVKHGKPVFMMEDALGFKQEADADKLAKAFQGRWPRLVFLSGCRTGQSVEQGELPSLCEALVRAGVPAVLGWALPVGDQAASQAAARLYEHLAGGFRIDEAVAYARQQLLAADSRYWHLLRLYANATALSELVTPRGHKGRVPFRVYEASAEFLDVAGKVGVCPRTRFIGRRRPLQRCLRVLKSFPGEADYHEGVLVHGMGGLGKSSLAARLCDRRPDYQRLVWVGQVDELAFLRVLADKLEDPKAIARLNEPGLSLKQRLRSLFKDEGALATAPALFVFDDFEHSLDRHEDGSVSLKPGALAVLRDLLAAIHETASTCRVIVTSRYGFPLPGPGTLYAEGLESLRGADLEKKTKQLQALKPDAETPVEVKRRALNLAAGNPRLLEWLDRVLQDRSIAEEAILAALESTEERFREEVLLAQLLEQQSESGQRLLAFLTLYELPVPRAAVAAVADDTKTLDADLARAAALGLVEKGQDTATQEARYYVSGLLDTCLQNELTEEEKAAAYQRATQHLYQIWWPQIWWQDQIWRQDQIWWQGGQGVTDEQALEIHRLALLAEEQAIAGEVADRFATRWVNNSRYREAERLCQDTLRLGEDYRLLHTLARAEEVLGKTSEARQHYESARAQCPQVTAGTERSVVAEYAAILHNLATLTIRQGDVPGALRLWQESLDLFEQIGDVQGKAATLNSMAGVIAQQGDVPRALRLWQESLDLSDQIGAVKGKAATLHEMAGVIAQQGDVPRALRLWQESLDLNELIGNVQGKAATLHQMAGVIAQQGDVPRALRLWQESLDLNEQIGHVQGKAVTLHNMAVVIAQQGDVPRALRLWQESLNLNEQTGDVQSKAATLNQMAGVIAQQGDVPRALCLWQESLNLNELFGDVQGKAATLGNMAWLAYSQGDTTQARTLWLQSAQALPSIQAWLDLTTVLGNLGTLDEDDAITFLAQAFWLALHVQVPLENTLNLTTTLLQKIGFTSEQAPLFAAAAEMLVKLRGREHPQLGKLQEDSANLLSQCAQEQGIAQDRLEEWLDSRHLRDPSQVFPAVERAIMERVGETGWLFDPAQFTAQS